MIRFFLHLFISLFLALASQAASGESVGAESAAKNRALWVARPAMETKVLTGFTRARAEMNVISEVSGRCLSVEADVGQSVGANGVFARLDDTFVLLDMEANQVEQARLKSRVAYLKKEVKRHRTLVLKKSEPQSNLDSLEQDTDQAVHQLRGLVTAGKILKERLDRFVIKAPPGWRVIERQVEPGQWVSVGASLAKLGDFSTLLAPLALSPAEYERLRSLPEPIELFSPAEKKSVPAGIERVNPAFDPVTRKIKLDMAVKQGLKEMRGGVRLELRLMMPDPTGAILAPPAALVERYQEYWLTKEDGSQVRAVVLGPGPDGLKRVISSSVKPGERLRLGQK